VETDNQTKTSPTTVQHRTAKERKESWGNPLYRPRQPQDSAYYHCVEDHFEDFEQVYEGRFERAYGFYRSLSAVRDLPLSGLWRSASQTII
jgi:hypothetical protein